MTTWVSTKLKFMVDWNNKKKCFKSDSGSVALKNNTWGTPNIPPGTQNLYLIELNCMSVLWKIKCYSLHTAIEVLWNRNHPMWTLDNLSIMGHWVNNYGWKYFGCSSNCHALNVTIFTKMQFSGKRINIFTIFFSIYFWGINHTMITNFWHSREKLTQFFMCCKENGP